MPPTRLCLIDDDRSTRTSLAEVLTAEGYLVESADDGASGLELALRGRFHAVLTDLRMPNLGGLELVAALRRERPNLPIVLMTAHGTTDTAIEAIRLGAYEYLLKPFEIEELLAVLEKAVTAARRAEDTVEFEDTTTRTGGPRMVGHSRAMQALYKEIGRIADKPLTVLIHGETGTGKELVARALFQHGERARKSFVAINCAAIPDTLLESELFGHERGAFTGADVRRIGRFEQAHGGTLFLDEIGDLSAQTQAKLLRVLQERVITRLGSRETIPVDVKIIAATHRDLRVLTAEGRFREDLFYRLAGVILRLPPLRERAEDVAPIVLHVLRRDGALLGVPEAEITPGALTWLAAQPWPGNVRQLENVVRQALLLARGFTITEEHARAAIGEAGRAAIGPLPWSAVVSEHLEAARGGSGVAVEAALVARLQHELYTQAVALAGGNLSQAARWLGITRLTLRERMIQLGLRTPNSDS